MIQYGKQYIDQDDIDSVVAVLKSDFLTTGPIVDQFEKIICDVTGAKYAVAVSNGTAALHCACLAAGITVGDEVITTPMTFAASANAVLYCGGTPVFADIDEDTWNIDPKSIVNLITEKTKAIIPVHYMGSVCDMDAIHDIAKKHNLLVIEDAAHALGSSYKGISVGAISDMTTFSFHPVKTITTGEGGAITTNQKELYEKLRLFRTHGIRRDQNQAREKGSWFYNQIELGYNYRITDIQCALGISQLNKLESFREKRAAIVREYNAFFEGNNYITRPTISNEALLHIYVIKLELNKMKKNRQQVFEQLRENNIGVNVHYIPVYYHDYYRNNGYDKTQCNNAEALYEAIITLPLHPILSMEETNYICSKIDEIVN